MRLGLIQPFPFLFLRQQLLLFRVFLLQLLRLQLMLLLDLLFLRLIRLLLPQVCVLLILLLLNFLLFLYLFGAELILLLLMPSIQLCICGRLNNGPRRCRNLVRMNCRRHDGPIGLRCLRIFVRILRTIR